MAVSQPYYLLLENVCFLFRASIRHPLYYWSYIALMAKGAIILIILL